MYTLKTLNKALDRATQAKEPVEVLLTIVNEMVETMTEDPLYQSTTALILEREKIVQARNSLLRLDSNNAKEVWLKTRKSRPFLERIFLSKTPTEEFEYDHEESLRRRAYTYIETAMAEGVKS